MKNSAKQQSASLPFFKAHSLKSFPIPIHPVGISPHGHLWDSRTLNNTDFLSRINKWYEERNQIDSIYFPYLWKYWNLPPYFRDSMDLFHKEPENKDLNCYFWWQRMDNNVSNHKLLFLLLWKNKDNFFPLKSKWPVLTLSSSFISD